MAPDKIAPWAAAAGLIALIAVLGIAGFGIVGSSSNVGDRHSSHTLMKLFFRQ
jgi:hypothetical protein